MISFLQNLASLVNRLEDALDTFRLYGSRDVPSLEQLIPEDVPHATGISAAEMRSLLCEYLQKTKLDYRIGVSDDDSRVSSDPIRRQMAIFPHIKQQWKENVYTIKRTAVDRALRDAEEVIRRSVSFGLQKIPEKLKPVLEYDQFEAVEEACKLNTAALELELRTLRNSLYEATGLQYHDNPELLYRLCFQAAARAQGWTLEKEDELVLVLEKQAVPLDLYNSIMTEHGIQNRPVINDKDNNDKRNKDNRNKDKDDKVSPNIPGPLPASQAYANENEIIFEDINCYDAEGKVTERYRYLRVLTNVFKNAVGQIALCSSYDAIVLAEEEKTLAPSSALACALLIAAYNNRRKPEIRNFLQQYIDKGNGSGFHILNTIEKWPWGEFLSEGQQDKSVRIVHYPSWNDFPSGQKGIQRINSQLRRHTIDVIIDNSFKETLLEDLLDKDSLSTKSQLTYFLQNWTGQPELDIFVKIASYFQRPAKISVPMFREMVRKNNNFLEEDEPAAQTKVAGAWLGCDSSNFNLDAKDSLDVVSGVRGLRLPYLFV